jgi:hypothetical protein
MCTFFDNLPLFHKDLQTKEDTGNRCWACPSPDSQVLLVTVHKDFNKLGVSTLGCPEMIPLCFTCAAAYINSLNAYLLEEQGSTGPETPWTVGSWQVFICRECVRSQADGLGAVPRLF